MKRNTYIIGPAGVGKSTVGKLLAEILEWGFIDLDETVEAIYRQSLEDIFAVYGPGTFQEMQSSVFNELAQGNHQVFTGNDALIVHGENFKLMKATGLVFCLEAAEATLNQRLDRRKYRFLAAEKYHEDLRHWLSDSSLFYSQADAIIVTDETSPRDIAHSIRKLLVDSGEYQF